jgi:hypothetical protein
MFRSFVRWCFVPAALAVVVLATTSRCPAEEPAGPSADGEWIQLFNGRDLAGWTAKIAGYEAGDNYADTFRVENGVLGVSYDKYDGPFDNRFGHLYYNQPFSHYVLRVEYRFVGEQCQGGPEWGRLNSGIMIHGQTPQSMTKDQFFPVSIEVQLLGGDKRQPRPTANVCTPGTDIVIDGRRPRSHCTNSSSESYPVGEWVTVEVEVHGDRLIRHKVSGRTVLEYNQPQLDETDPDAKRLIDAGAPKRLTSGTISLQSESQPVEFRKVELRRLGE